MLQKSVSNWRDRWSVRFLGSLATIAIGVPTVTFGSITYWDALTTPDIAEAVNPTCTPDVYAIVVAAIGASLIEGPEIAALGAAYVLITDAIGPVVTKFADRLV